MANIISNNNTNNNNNISSGNISVGVGSGNAVNSLRDVVQTNTQPLSQANLPAGTCPYDHIIDMIRGLDLQDDVIVMNHKIKSIQTDFCNIMRDENMLCESMEYINDKALADGDTALKFALLFSSHTFDALAMKETKVRSAMLKILETNFYNAEVYRVHDKDRLYNSITLLGEYYHRVRLADNSPIKILGSSLLELLIREVNESEPINKKLAKVILSQITLNGNIMRSQHEGELTELLYHIRRNLIEQPSLKPVVKALLIMSLDLYYSNFANLGAQLEEMYTQYLVQEHEEDEGNNNMYPQVPQIPQLQQPQSPHEVYQSQAQETQSQFQAQASPNHLANYSPISHQPDKKNSHSESHNGLHEPAANNETFEDPERPTTPPKKWSELVCEDSILENEIGISDSGLVSSTSLQDSENTSNSSNNHSKDMSKNTRRSYQPRSSPRPLKKHPDEHEQNNSRHQQHNTANAVNEDMDETKPLPRWRAPRFNRDATDQQQHGGPGGRPRNQHRRFSASYEDDQSSVRSEGGSIRLYSINDRLKHAQEKLERSNGSHYNNIANSNWDRQSQRDDRSERSYISNYERGNHNHRRNHGHHYNNRQGFDKPPRFQKFQNQHQQYANKDHKIHSESWRRSNNSYDNNGPESNSRSNSRARTLPRPAKSNMDGQKPNNSNSYRRSQSPTRNNYNRGDPNARSRNYNPRWSSQSSLASESSLPLDRRTNSHQKHNQKNSGFNRPKQGQNWDDDYTPEKQPPPETSHWQSKDNSNDDELVRNARQTTKYMEYLSSK